MITNKKVFGKAVSMPVGIGLGVGLSVVLLIMGCAVIATLLEQEMISQNQIGYGAMAVLFISSIIGSATAVFLVKRRRLMVSLLHGSCYLGLLFMINGLLFGGTVEAGWVTAILLYGASCAAALLLSHGNGQKKLKLEKVRTG